MAESDCIQTVVKIEYWWDRLSRQWIIQAMDVHGNQIDDARYAPNRCKLPAELMAMRAKHPTAQVVKS